MDEERPEVAAQVEWEALQRQKAAREAELRKRPTLKDVQKYKKDHGRDQDNDQNMGLEDVR